MAAPGVIKITQKRVRPAEATSSSSSRSSSRPSKRYRKFGAGSGAPETRRDTEGRVSTAAHLAEHALSGSSYLSLRSLPLSAPPSLVNCCLRLSSVAIVDLALDMVLRLVQAKREDTIAALQLDDLAAIPTTIMARLAPRVLQEASKLDDHLGHVSTVLLNTFLNPTTSSSFALPPALSVSCTITSPVLRRIAQCTHLELLDLSAQASLKDAPLRGVLPRLHHLTKVVFKGCTQVGDETAKTISNHSTLHATLLHLNLNYTAITWQGLVKLLSSLRSLQVLKIASLNGITDKNISRMLDQVLAAISDPSFIPLSTLTVLKLKRTAIADAGVGRLLSHTPQLKSLDISWTSVKSLDVLSMSSASPLHSFTKLVLSGLNLRPNSLHQCFSQLSGDAPPGVEPRLETLKLGSLEDDTLKKMIPPLSRLKHLTRISLFGNEKIGNNGAVLSDFLSRVGRRCITLDLTNVVQAGSNPKLPADSLAGLALSEEGVETDERPRLRVLVLDATRVNDDAAWIIACCKDLEELHLENARITEDGLKQVLRGCPKLKTLNLSGCRGISMSLRRDAFAILEQLDSESY